MSVNLSSDELKKFADNGVSTAAIRRTVDTYRRDGWSDDAIRRKIDDKLSAYDATGLNDAQLNARAKLERSLAARENNPTTGRATEPMSDADEQFFKNFFKKADQQRRMEKARQDVSTLPGAMRTSGERIINSATLGLYGALNDALGGNFDERNAAGQENLRNAGAVGKVINTTSNLVNDIAGGAPLGAGIYNAAGKVTTKALPRLMLSAAAGGGMYSGLNSRGDLGERATDAITGAAIGAATAPIMYFAQKAAGKAFDKIADKVSTKHASAKYADVAGDINKIAADDDAFRVIKRGVKANDDVARTVRDQTDAAMARHGDNVQIGVSKVFDKYQKGKTGTSVVEDMDMVRQNYADFMKEYGSRMVDKWELSAIMKKHPEIKPYIEAARTHGPTTGMPENSFAVLHDANRRMKMDLRDRMVNSSSKLQDKSYGSNALDKFLDTKVGERDFMDKAFRRRKLRIDMLDDIDRASRGESTNFAGKLLNNETKKRVAELYSPETADDLAKYLRSQSRNFDQVKALNNGAKTKLREIGVEKRPFWREAVESVGSMVGSVADKATAGYRRRMNTNLANRILDGNIGRRVDLGYNPILASVLMGVHNAGMTADNMKTLREAQQELIDLPMTVNGLSPAGADKYYHNLGQYKNAQKGIESAYNSQVIGALKELRDMPGKLRRGVGVSTALSDALQDMSYNLDGGIEGLYNSTPAEQNKALNSRKTREMRLLEQILRGQ